MPPRHHISDKNGRENVTQRIQEDYNQGDRANKEKYASTRILTNRIPQIR